MSTGEGVGTQGPTWTFTCCVGPYTVGEDPGPPWTVGICFPR